MEVPAHFAMPDDQLRSVLEQLGVADLVTVHADGLLATPLPLLFDPEPGEHGALIGHVARNNRQWSTPTTAESLVIARPTDHYVSPAWLPSKTEHGQVVPTWDYLTVHVYGDLVAHDDPAWTREAVRRLTERHEGAGGWTVEDPPGDYVERMLRAIVGIELRITRIEAKAKMAQNKTPADVAALATALREHGDERGAAYLTDVSLPAARRRADLLTDLRSGTTRR